MSKSNVPPPPETVAANQYHSYLRGWQDGTRCKSNPQFANHFDGQLSYAYRIGYVVGCSDYQIAAQNAQDLYGHTPSPLQTAP